MKATITSTDQIVSISRDGKMTARVWEGVTEGGVAFTAFVSSVAVHKSRDYSKFERDLQEHKPPEGETLRAIDARLIF